MGLNKSIGNIYFGIRILLFLVLLFAFSFSNAYNVIIYGVDNCGYTTDLRNECIKNNISFTYRNVNETQYYYEMASVVSEFNLAVNNYVDLPVVKVTVDGKSFGFSRPSIDKIKQLIGTTFSGLITIDNLIHSDDILKIYDLNGKYILLPGTNLGYLPAGIYIIKAKIHDKSETIKFIKP